MNELLSQLPSLLPLAVKWVEDQEAIILRDGAPLAGQTLADAKTVGVAYPEKIRVLYGAAMPVPVHPSLLAAGKASGLIGAGRFSHALNIWAVLLLGCFAALPMWVFFTWLLWESPRWITYLRHGFRNCPHCGSRDWKKPHYSGFGL